MGFFDNLLGKLAQLTGRTVQGTESVQKIRDYYDKGRSFSIESEVCEALADLMLMLSTMPISGESERARWLDDLSDVFFRVKAKPLVSSAFLTGDAIVVPSWNGRNIQNTIVSADDFEVLGNQGDELTAVGYVVDTCVVKSQEYKLLQAIELFEYKANDGSDAIGNRYRMYIAKGDTIIGDSLELFPQWRGLFDKEFVIPNVDRLLVGRYKSFAIDPMNLNSVKGIPLCFGASEPIGEIHYLLDQMHNEFGMSEKMIMADKRLLSKEKHGDRIDTVLPRGRERLFEIIGGNSNDMPIQEWAPEIRYQAYLEAIDKQEKLVEKAVGVSGGIISSSNDVNYQNVDNIRKSQQKTMSFVSTARKVAEDCLLDLVYAWETLANYYGINPVGEYEVSFDWSNEYIETFADRQNAILAGEAIGATDAVDYRMFVMEESPEAAKERVAEIQAAQVMEVAGYGEE